MNDYRVPLRFKDVTITIEWHIDDVRSIAHDIDVTDEQCMEVLWRAKEYHDANVGINWDVLRYHLDNVLGGE